MLKFVRKIVNAVLLNSPYHFEDGSRISYLAQFDILRYWTAARRPKMLDIALTYNKNTGLMHIGTALTWKWRDANVPLNQNSEVGVELTVQEKAEVINKLREFIQKHPKKYERFDATG